MLQNPIDRVLAERNMTVGEFTILCGTQRSWIQQLRRGDAPKLSGRVLDACVELGYDKQHLAEEYLTWRQKLAEQVRQKCMA
jgi:hypothetical protein